MKKLFLLFTSFLFLSCNFYISDRNCDDVTKKTEIKDIAECTDPIVITMPVYDELDLFGNRKLGSRYECLGDIFVVIDTQTNDLFDWVFCPNKEGSVLWRCVELGTNPKKYFSSCGTLQCCIQAGSTKVNRFETDCRGRYMENYSTPGTKGLLIGYAWDDEKDSENIWVRGTRVYFMRSRNTQKVTFMYFDLETHEKSEVFALNYEDVILR